MPPLVLLKHLAIQAVLQLQPVTTMMSEQQVYVSSFSLIPRSPSFSTLQFVDTKYVPQAPKNMPLSPPLTPKFLHPYGASCFNS